MNKNDIVKGLLETMSDIVTLNVKTIHKDAVLPAYAKEGDAGFDFYSVEDVAILPNETAIVPTGLCIELKKGTELQVRPRSGISLKGCPCILEDGTTKNVHVRVMLGTVDCGYRGEVGIITWNPTNEKVVIPKGTRIAQGVISPVINVIVKKVEELSESSRGEGGFGSTGVK